MDQARNDLLALLGGSALVSPPAPPAADNALDRLFGAASPPTVQQQPQRAAPGPSAAQANDLLSLLSAPSPKAAAVSPGPAPANDLLSQLFGTMPMTSTPRPAEAPAPLPLPSTAMPDTRPAPGQQRPPLSPAAADRQATTGVNGGSETKHASQPAPLPPATSPFDYVSPFDVLAKITPQAKAQPPAATTTTAVVSAPPAAARAPEPVPTTAVASASQPRAVSGRSRPGDGGEQSRTSSRARGGPPPRSTDDEPSISSPPMSTDFVARMTTEPREVRPGGTLDVRLDTATHRPTTPLQVTPITRFTTPEHFVSGQRLALPGQTIAYATKLGRIRVLDRATGSRLLLKIHSAPIVDMQASDTVDHGWVNVATCAQDGKLALWRIPPSFDDRTATYEVIAEIAAATPNRFARLHWAPGGRRLCVLTAEGRVVLLDLDSKAWRQSVSGQTSIGESAAVSGQQVTAAAGYVDASFVDDGSRLVLASETAAGVRRLDVVDVRDIHTPIASLTPKKTRHPVSHVVTLEPSVYAVCSQSGLHIEILSAGFDTESMVIQVAEAEPSSFAHVLWDSAASALFVATSRGIIHILRLLLPARSGTLAVVDTTEVFLEEAIITFAKPANDPSLFAVMSSGIAQLHLPDLPALAAVVPPPEATSTTNGVEEGAEAEDVVTTDVSGAVEVTTETVIVTEDDVDTSKDFVERPQSPTRVSNGTSAAESSISHRGTSDANLLTEIRKLLADLTSASERHLADERVRDKEAELIRQEMILQTVSETLTQNTGKAIDASIRAGIKSSVVPALSKPIKEAVDREIKAAVQDSVKQGMPDAMERLFQKPEVVSMLAKQMANATKDLLQENIVKNVHLQLNTALQKTISSSMDKLIKEVRGEMVDIRKAIIAEQSTALSALAADVAAVRARLDAMPPGGAQERAAQSTPNISVDARKPTPVQVYADEILNALQAPASDELDNIIVNCPEHKFRTLFANRPSPLPLPHLLGLVYKLSQRLAVAPSPLGLYSRLHLVWLRAASDAVDKQKADVAVAARMPTIFDQAINALVHYRDRLNSAGDRNGVQVVTDCIGTVQQAIMRG